jgi:hypothetical protein
MKYKAFVRAGVALVSLLMLVGSLSAESKAQSTIETDENALFGGSEDEKDENSSVDGSTKKTDSTNETGDTKGSLEDNLFGSEDDGEESFIEDVRTTAAAEISTSLLSSEDVEIGGRFGFSAANTWIWRDPSTIVENIDSPDSDAAAIELTSRLFFDARPADDFRAFGKMTLAYPFDDNGGSRTFDEVFNIEELFADFIWNDTLYFRGGKHAINWGVGYFFSPADLLNITEIDPENPEAEREGPVSVKTHFPFGANNLYLYFIANDIETIKDVAIAAKVEMLLASMEAGIGALYQRDVPPSGMLTLTFPVGDIDVFGEAVIRYHADRLYPVVPDTFPLAGLELEQFDEEFFFQASVGLSYIYTFDEFDSSLSITGQYYYNGEGYADPLVLTDFFYDSAVKSLIIADNGFGTSDIPEYPGTHYAAANVGWQGAFGSDVSLSVLWLHSFSDTSGMVAPSVGLELFGGLDLALRIPYTYGESGAQYSPIGDTLSVQLSIGIDGGF